MSPTTGAKAARSVASTCCLSDSRRARAGIRQRRRGRTDHSAVHLRRRSLTLAFRIKGRCALPAAGYRAPHRRHRPQRRRHARHQRSRHLKARRNRLSLVRRGRRPPTTLLTGCSSTSGDSCTTSTPWTSRSASDTILPRRLASCPMGPPRHCKRGCTLTAIWISWYLASATPPVVVGPGTLGGARNSANLFDGSLDELVVCERALAHRRNRARSVLEIVAVASCSGRRQQQPRVRTDRTLTFNGYICAGRFPCRANLVGSASSAPDAATCPPLSPTATSVGGRLRRRRRLPAAGAARRPGSQRFFQAQVEALPAAGQTVTFSIRSSAPADSLHHRARRHRARLGRSPDLPGKRFRLPQPVRLQHGARPVGRRHL